MKLETTRKAIVNSTAPNYLKQAGYCSMQHLLYFKSPAAYTRGVYGWNFDAYQVGNYTICTGYRGMPGKQIAPYEELEKYETAAEKIIYDNSIEYEERAAAVDKLLNDLLAGKPYAEQIAPEFPEQIEKAA